jgi:hypothetical protein
MERLHEDPAATPEGAMVQDKGTDPHTGRCLCGGLRFTVTGPLRDVINRRQNQEDPQPATTGAVV